MRKIILFALLLSAMNMMGQAYEFETEEKSFDGGLKSVTCKCKKLVELNAFSPDISIIMWDYFSEDMMPFVGFHICKFAGGIHKNSFALTKTIRELAFSVPEDEEIKRNVPINLFLSNGDILHAKSMESEISVSSVQVSSVQRRLMERTDSVGVVEAYIGLSYFKSVKIPKEIQTKENRQVICQQLRTYDIVKIEVDGVSFDVRGLRSAATFDAMFNALAQKTGKGHLYRYNSSSSSSNVSSGPSASCELGDISILSNGKILCRLDNVEIEDAKGKEVEIYVSLDDVETDDNAFVLDKKVTPSYKSSVYKSILLNRNVNDGYSMFPKKGGRFKVYATFYISTGRKGNGGYGTELIEIGKSSSKFITIFRKPSGAWDCY